MMRSQVVKVDNTQSSSKAKNLPLKKIVLGLKPQALTNLTFTEQAIIAAAFD